MSNNCGVKRQATSPVGATFKDPRYESRGNNSNKFDALGDYVSDGGEWTGVKNGRAGQHNNPNINNQHQPQTASGSTIEGQTFVNVASQRAGPNQTARSTGTKKTLERMLRTAPLDGQFRDNIIVEIRQVNGVPFKGSLHYKEAKYSIFERCLDMDPTMIQGLSFAFSNATT